MTHAAPLGRVWSLRRTHVSNADDPHEKAEFDRELAQFERTRKIGPSKLVKQEGAETEKSTGRWTAYDESGPYCTHCTLTLESNGSFELSVSHSEPAGWAGGYSVQGHWTQEGAQLHFVVRQRSDEHGLSRLETATVHGSTLELPGFGTFERAP
jgi:hypothetical protein